jgi:hypothetical protein
MSSEEEEEFARDLPDDALTSDGELHLVVTTGGIVVTMPGTDFVVGYRKVKETPGLTVSHLHDDPDASIKQAEFLARAWSAANDRARELGWIA